MIYIIRHGQTELNQRNVLQGRSDYPLNSKGVEQGKNAARALSTVHFDRVYSSPLIRAAETAKIIAPYCEIQFDDRLIEMDYGPYEGLDLAVMPHEVLTFFKDFVHNPAPKGMESLSCVVERVGVFLEERCRTEENILISTHAIAMKGILEYLTPGSGGSYWKKYIGNCAVYVTDFQNGAFFVPMELDLK